MHTALAPVRGFACVAAVVAAVATADCAAAPRRRPEVASSAAPRHAAALDSASVRRLCAAPDSVLARRAACVLRDQRPPLRVF